MRTIFQSSLVLFCVASALSAQTPTRNNVVIISLDGTAEYMLEDPQVPMPTLMRMAKEGVKAEYMLPINPTITWPNHTSIVTGVGAEKHLLLFNGKLEWPSPEGPPHINPKVPEMELVHATTLYDVAHKAGLTTGQVDWPAADGSPNIDWAFGECPDLNGAFTKEVITAGLASSRFVTGCLGGPQAWRNRLWSDAGVLMIEKHHPNLTLIHLLSPDSIHHMYGTGGFASSYALAFSDDRVREILEAIKRAGMEKTTTVFVVSDHGHRDIEKAVHPDVVLRQAGILQGTGKSATSPVWIVPDSGVAMFFIPKAADRPALLAKLTTLFHGVEGVDQVLTGDALLKAGFPSHAREGADPNTDMAPDMVLGAAPGYAFEGGPGNTLITASRQKSTHGFINTDPKMRAICIAWGAGIKPGSTLSTIRNVDIAPTVARILGISLPDTDGRVLEEILR